MRVADADLTNDERVLLPGEHAERPGRLGDRPGDGKVYVLERDPIVGRHADEGNLKAGNWSKYGDAHALRIRQGPGEW